VLDSVGRQEPAVEACDGRITMWPVYDSS